MSPWQSAPSLRHRHCGSTILIQTTSSQTSQSTQHHRGHHRRCLTTPSATCHSRQGATSCSTLRQETTCGQSDPSMLASFTVLLCGSGFCRTLHSVSSGYAISDPTGTRCRTSPTLPGPGVVRRRIVHLGVCLLWRCSSSGTTHQCRASASAASTASAACSSECLGCSAWATAPCPSSWRYVELLSREPIRRLGCQVPYAQQRRCHDGSRNLPYSRYSTTCRRRVSSPWRRVSTRLP